MRYSDRARTQTVWQLVLLAYSVPYSLVGLGMVASAVLYPTISPYRLGIAGMGRAVIRHRPANRAIKGLGLGAYEAEVIVLDPDFCTRDLSELGIAQDCTLRNVHVVWSFGDAMVLRPALDEPRQIQIPAVFVRSLVQKAAVGD